MTKEKATTDWFIDMPWGKLAMVSWGDPAKPPVFLVHGYIDSAAGFIPLVNLLPDDYYYVACDLPGHGLSDPLPDVTVSEIHFVEPIRYIVERMKWNSFICIAHSLGYVVSSAYNSLYPGKISKMVGLDPAYPLSFYTLAYRPAVWYQAIIANYFENYYGRPEDQYTYEEAVAHLMSRRSLTAEQGALILSRCLAPTEQGKFRFTWKQNIKKIVITPIPPETLYEMLKTETPTLIFLCSWFYPTKARGRNIMNELQRQSKRFLILDREGDHNLHFCNPEAIVDDLVKFLKTDFSVQSKL